MGGKRRDRALLVICATIGLGASAQGQKLLYAVQGHVSDTQLGTEVVGLGDVNGDGVPDFASIAPKGNNEFQTTYVVACSGRDGDIIWARASIGGLILAPLGNAGDIDGDGCDDVILGGGLSRIVSGRDGRNIRVFPKPIDETVGVGDVDLDGFPDLASGTPKVKSPNGFLVGGVVVTSGPDGTLIHETIGTTSFAQLGWSLAGMGDLDGDGRPDLLVGAPADSLLHGSFGHAVVMSAFDGRQFATIANPSPLEGHFARTVKNAGDVNADGTQDFLIASPSPISFVQGTVRVFSGVSFEILFEKTGSGLFGADVASARDIDFDGFADILIGAPDPVSGDEVHVYSGRNGGLLTKYSKDSSFVPGALIGNFGRAVTTVGDVDGDGCPDVLIASPGSTTGLAAPQMKKPLAGLVTVHSGCPGSAEAFGSGCPGAAPSAPTLEVAGCPVQGVAITMQLRGGVPNGLALVLFGNTGAAIPVAGCTLLVAPPFHAAVVAMDATGALDLPVTLPVGSPTTFAAQGIMAEVSAQHGLRTTNSVQVRGF